MEKDFNIRGITIPGIIHNGYAASPRALCCSFQFGTAFTLREPQAEHCRRNAISGTGRSSGR
jgi:hypothetical protein